MVKNLSRRLKRCGFDSWVRKIPWSRKWQPVPIFFPGKFHGQTSLEGPQCTGLQRLSCDWTHIVYMYVCMYVCMYVWCLCPSCISTMRFCVPQLVGGTLPLVKLMPGPFWALTVEESRVSKAIHVIVVSYRGQDLYVVSGLQKLLNTMPMRLHSSTFKFTWKAKIKEIVKGTHFIQLILL